MNKKKPQQRYLIPRQLFKKMRLFQETNERYEQESRESHQIHAVRTLPLIDALSCKDTK